MFLFIYNLFIYLFTNENDIFRRIYSKFSHANFQARVQLAASFTLKNLLFVSDSSSCKMKYKPIRSSTYNWTNIVFSCWLKKHCYVCEGVWKMLHLSGTWFCRNVRPSENDKNEKKKHVENINAFNTCKCIYQFKEVWKIYNLILNKWDECSERRL